jgi:hypothetical protein
MKWTACLRRKVCQPEPLHEGTFPLGEVNSEAEKERRREGETERSTVASLRPSVSLPLRPAYLAVGLLLLSGRLRRGDDHLFQMKGPIGRVRKHQRQRDIVNGHAALRLAVPRTVMGVAVEHAVQRIAV